MQCFQDNSFSFRISYIWSRSCTLHEWE